LRGIGQSCSTSRPANSLRYIKSYFTDIPELAALVDGEMTKEGFSLKNGVDVIVSSNSFKAVRGHPILLCIMDETSFWSSDDSAKPPEEVLAAVEPGLVSLIEAGSRIISITTPFRRAGMVWNKFEKHFGSDIDPDIYVLQATSRTMNPTIPQEYIDKKLAQDYPKARTEYYAEFRDDVGGFIERPLLLAAVDSGVLVRPPFAAHTYFGFADMSGGKSDSATLAVAHVEDGGYAVLDAVIEAVPPFNHTTVVQQMAALLREYGITEITGDRYGADLTVNLFATHGIRYRASERDRSRIYEDCLPLFSSGRARLLDLPKLINQFSSLVRTPGSAGRDRIDTPPGLHEDLANACAGALVSAIAEKRRPKLMFG
jgi:hypothetical protein